MTDPLSPPELAISDQIPHELTEVTGDPRGIAMLERPPKRTRYLAVDRDDLVAFRNRLDRAGRTLLQQMSRGRAREHPPGVIAQLALRHPARGDRARARRGHRVEPGCRDTAPEDAVLATKRTVRMAG